MSSLMLLIPIGVLVGASILGLVGRGKRTLHAVNILSATASLLIVYMAILGFERGLELKLWVYASSSVIASLNQLIFKVDQLSAFFLLILGILGFCTSLYGIKYMERYLGKEDLRLYNFNYPIFLLMMYLILTCWNLLWFIIFWELMTFFSQFLVAFERNKEKAIRAAYKYFCMTKAGADFLVLSVILIILNATRFNANYSEISKVLPFYLQSNPSMLYVLTSALLIGFGVKAAMVPFHSWLPDAHPEAPSNVSALLSGVMIKLPIYMLFRFFISFFPRNAGIGMLIASFGVITLFFTMMYALIQEDSKRLLAYSSIDNIGYVLLPLGTGLYLMAKGNQFLGSIALMASLYHTINHAFFKGLLFLTAGSVIYETGSRDLNYLGGLAKKMPLTGFAAMTASFAIAGMPPLNGFVSKWMIYISTLSSPASSLFGIIALFISGVTLAAFVKYFTSIFTRPSLEEIEAREVPLLMWAPQMLLAFLCILFGVYPRLPVKLISGALNSLGVQMDMSRLVIYPSVVIPDRGSFSPIVIFSFILITTFLMLLLIPSKGKQFSVWKCGIQEELNVRLPASSYYRDFEEEFGEVYKIGDLSMHILKKLVDLGKGAGLKFEAMSYDLNSMLSIAMILIVILVAVLGGVGL